MNDIKENSKKSKEEIAEAYSSHPWWYDVRGFFILTFAYRSTLWDQVFFFGKNMEAKHLEVAIGTGTLMGIVLRWRKFKNLPTIQIVGVDYAEPMLDGARVRFAGNSDISLQHADVANMSFPDDCFDTVNIANSVHCFPDVDGAFHEVMRVLKPRGKLAFNVLLYPPEKGFFAYIARRINSWGINKGILYTPYQSEDIRVKVLSTEGEIIFEKITGNTLNMVVQKR